MAPALMKGKKWKDRAHLVTYPVVVEEKVDEVRCHVRRVHDSIEFLSYAGNYLANMEPFAERMLQLMQYCAVSELDLGFEVNHDFDSSRRWIRSTNGLPDDLKGAYSRFILFDVPEWVAEFAERKENLAVVARYARNRCGLEMDRPRFSMADNAEDVARLYEMFREDGAEGIMVKTLDHRYKKGKRIDGWLKFKPEEDADGRVIALHEAVCGKDQPDLGLKVGDLLGRVGSVSIKMDDGSIATPHGIAHDLGRDMLLNPGKYIGERAEFKYMMRDTQGGYRHCVWHRLRDH